MAHPCDHYEKSTYSGNRSKLNMSPSTMNRTPTQKFPIKSQGKTWDETVADQSKTTEPVMLVKLKSNVSTVTMKDSHAYILASNFIRQNDTWAIRSAYDYCLKYYAEFGLTKEIFALAVSDYVLSK